jgi:hypothetical protein
VRTSSSTATADRRARPRPLQQLAERNRRRGLVGADLLQVALALGHRVDPGVHRGPVPAARQLLYVTLRHAGSIARTADSFQIPFHAGRQETGYTASELEPPIGIEPMTYALRGGLEPSTAVQAVTSILLARFIVPQLSGLVQGRC